ncbi:MAG: site-specific DNA-methyltransferase [Lentimicrobium sp.]
MEDRLDLASPDLVNDNFEKLATLFPNCVTESAEGKAIDFDLLKQELNHAVIQGNKERYRLEWPGKKEAIVTANLPTNKTLRPIREDSVNFDKTENLYIEGDNLEVLKLLQESYLGKIKMIYIDPPYNTGQDFVYKDNFAKDSDEYIVESGQKDEYNQRLYANPETSGRYHSDWLSMIYPRLKLARTLLKNDGVIFISIDDVELHNLRKMCDEIFSQENFVANFIWEKRTNRENRKTISYRHDNILCYIKSKNIEKALNQLPMNDKALANYKNPDNDFRGLWKSDPATAQAGHGTKSQFYELVAPNNRVHKLESGRCWLYTKPIMEEAIADNRIWFGKDGNGVPRIKTYLNAKDRGLTPETILFAKDVTTNEISKNKLKILFDGVAVFETPKPVELVKLLIQISTNPLDALVLDFFSGSSTTAHGTIQLNSEDGGNRKFIQVQLPEATDSNSEAFKAGYNNICEIGKERIRRAAKQIVNFQIANIKEKELELDKLTKGQLSLDDEKIANIKDEIESIQSVIGNLDTGFRVYRLDSSNMQDVYYKPQEYDQKALDLFADNVKSDRSADDLLAQVMLDWGLPLSLKIEQVSIAGKKVFNVAENSLYACFDTGIDEEFARAIANDAPLRVVFRDNGFKDDTAKVNVKQLLKQLSPETEMKVI